MLFIPPDECLDCEACRSECPADASFYDGNVPEPWREFIAHNRGTAPLSPSITIRKEPLARRDERA